VYPRALNKSSCTGGTEAGRTGVIWGTYAGDPHLL
jgi:hypothetical protein